MLKATRFLFSIFFLLFIHLNGFSQSTFENVVKQDLYTTDRSIVNGIDWTNSIRYQGNRFYGSKQWKNGEVLFNGKLYSGLQINYDILNDELILYDNKLGEEKYIQLNKELIERFRLFSENNTSTFIHTKLIDSKEKEIYEEVYVGPISFYIQHKKAVKKEIGTTYMGQLYDSNTFYLCDSSGAYSFKNKKKVLQFLGNSKELKKYIRKENLKINRSYPNDVIRLLMYNESLTSTNGI